MSFKEVKILRKSGELGKALELAIVDYESNPENIWSKRSIMWVYYDYLKIAVVKEDIYDFFKILDKIRELNLPEDESMFFDTYIWQVGKMLYILSKQKNKNLTFLSTIFNIIKEQKFSKPSDGYSYLLKAFNKFKKNWESYYLFVEWWKLENLQDADFNQSDYNGRKLPSIAEQTYSFYAKKIINEAESHGLSTELNLKIDSLIPLLDNLINKHPEFQFTIYHKVKLLLLIGEKEINLRPQLITFVKKKEKDFWAWDLLGDLYSDDLDKKKSCLCKALSVSTRDEFTIKIRSKLIEILIEENNLPEAKFEINKVAKIRLQKNWRESNINYSNQDWFEKTENIKSNSSLYQNNKHIAESLLLEGVEDHFIIVDYVNQDKQIINFIKNKKFRGFFNYSNKIKTPKIGDIYKVKFNHKPDIEDKKIGKAKLAGGVNPNSVYCNILTIEKHLQKDDCAAYCLKESNIKIIEDKKIGFLEDIFVGREYLTGVTNNQKIKVEAMLSYDKNKKKWSWKCFNIIKNN